MDSTAITARGLERLSEELERLTTDGRREIAERLRHAAASAANSTENADYFAACTDQARLEQRIALLQDLGERVRVRDLDSGERLEFELVGPHEFDPAAGRISTVSPLGKAIAGLRRGQIADVDTPRGRLRSRWKAS